MADKTLSKFREKTKTDKGRPSPVVVPQPVKPSEIIEKPPEPPPPPKPLEPFKPPEEIKLFPEKPAFLPPKQLPHSPKISPSSIPNPSPSVSTTKQVESGYPNYSGYLYSIPGYSAFQPVAYQGLSTQSPQTITPLNTTPKETNKIEFVPYSSNTITETAEEKKNIDSKTQATTPKTESPKAQTDFEDHFTPEIIPASENKTSCLTNDKSNEPKQSISHLSQGSSTVDASQITIQDIKKKQSERFSLKTSIPISKIDLKCVNTPPDSTFQNKKVPTPFNPAFLTPKEAATRVEIQSNIVIKTAQNKEPEVNITEPPKPITSSASQNNISTLINAAESINSNDTQFWKKEQKPDTPTIEKKEVSFSKPIASNRPIFNPLNAETKINFSNKPPDGFNEQKNQIVFIQNKNTSNSKMFLTISQQQTNNPQVLLQRTNIDSKNMQAPSRLSSLNKKCKDELVNEKSTSSKVVALKRLHHENCDENDFENLITENQIYGNKIVVKEKAQGTQQEQDLKNNLTKITSEKSNQTSDTKNLVLQPNFLYLSNLQFPANLMMIKNKNKINQNSNENKTGCNDNTELGNCKAAVNNDLNPNVIKTLKTQNVAATRELHILKSNNNALQTLSNKTSTKDLIFQTNQKVIMNSQILYQVPMIVETDGTGNNVQKIAPTFVNRDYTKFLAHNKKELPRIQEAGKPNDKLFIACPYQMDAKVQPKIVIANIRPKISKGDDISTLDMYEKRRRIRRLKHLTLRDKDQKADRKEKTDLSKNIITPDKMKAAIYKEFSNSKMTFKTNSSDSDSDYEENELKEYEAIMEQYGTDNIQDKKKKIAFLSHFKLGTHNAYKERLLDRQERSLSKDAVAAAYISAGRIDRISNDIVPTPDITNNVKNKESNFENQSWNEEIDSIITLQRKQAFFKNLQLLHVSPQYKQDYERTWQEIVKERRRRDDITSLNLLKTKPKTQPDKMALDTKDQLQILTDIKKSVNENNNLIKKKLDSFCQNPTMNAKGDSIYTLAEKNFSELSKLSKMADRSVKLFSGQETRKRDLNPGFDSENIQNIPKLHCQSYPNINIPNISKIISLKSSQEPSFVNTAPATSMDEPQNSAAGSREDRGSGEAMMDETCARESEVGFWPGIEAVMKSYKQFEIARKKEIAHLQRRNTQLRVDIANANRMAAREAELARTLLAERHTLANDEHNVRLSIQRLSTAVEVVRNYN